MNSNRRSRLVLYVALTLLTGCFGVGRAHAQSLNGKFTLPVETRWGQAVLPAGDYNLTRDEDDWKHVITIRGQAFVAMVSYITHDYTHNYSAGDSTLTLVRHGNKGTI